MARTPAEGSPFPARYGEPRQARWLCAPGGRPGPCYIQVEEPLTPSHAAQDRTPENLVEVIQGSGQDVGRLAGRSPAAGNRLTSGEQVAVVIDARIGLWHRAVPVA